VSLWTIFQTLNSRRLVRALKKTSLHGHGHVIHLTSEEPLQRIHLQDFNNNDGFIENVCSLFVERCDVLVLICRNDFSFRHPLHAERSPADISFGLDNSEQQKRRGGTPTNRLIVSYGRSRTFDPRRVHSHKYRRRDRLREQTRSTWLQVRGPHIEKTRPGRRTPSPTSGFSSVTIASLVPLSRNLIIGRVLSLGFYSESPVSFSTTVDRRLVHLERAIYDRFRCARPPLPPAWTTATQSIYRKRTSSHRPLAILKFQAPDDVATSALLVV